MTLEHVLEKANEIEGKMGKPLLTIEESGQYLVMDSSTIKEIISCGQLKPVNCTKKFISVLEIAKFVLGYVDEAEDKPIDSQGNQRYPSVHSIEIENLFEEQWETMKRNGIKELTPYWNEDRKKWCLALSLGYGENHKRIRKVITADSQEELWGKYGEFKIQGLVLPNEDVKESSLSAEPASEVKDHIKGNMLFRDYFIQYLKGLDGSTRSRSYSSMVTLSVHIVEGLGDYKMCEINKAILKEFINGLTKKTYVKGTKNKTVQYYSQSTINKIYDLLHGAIKEAAGEDGDQILRMDFMANIKKPRANKCMASEAKALSDDEMKMLLEVVKENPMIWVWIHSLEYTGVRPSEPLALKFSDIDYENKTIDIFKTLSQEEYYDATILGKKKAAKAIITDLKNERPNKKINLQKRTLKVSDHILRILKSWETYVKGNNELMEMRRNNGTEEYLFTSPSGRLWLYDDYKQVYDRLLEKHNLDVTKYNPYRFRHNYCTRLFRLNINIKTAQLIMGDNSPDMIMKVYANLDKSDVLKGSKIYSDSLDIALGVVKRVDEELENAQVANNGKQ